MTRVDGDYNGIYSNKHLGIYLEDYCEMRVLL